MTLSRILRTIETGNLTTRTLVEEENLKFFRWLKDQPLTAFVVYDEQYNILTLVVGCNLRITTPITLGYRKKGFSGGTLDTSLEFLTMKIERNITTPEDTNLEKRVEEIDCAGWATTDFIRYCYENMNQRFVEPETDQVTLTLRFKGKPNPAEVAIELLYCLNTLFSSNSLLIQLLLDPVLFVHLRQQKSTRCQVKFMKEVLKKNPLWDKSVAQALRVKIGSADQNFPLTVVPVKAVKEIF